MSDIIIAAIASLSLGSLTGFLVYINWKILKVSEKILDVSVEVLKETVIIRIETVKIRDISEDVLVETTRLRKVMGDPLEYTPKPKNQNKKFASTKNVNSIAI